MKTTTLEVKVLEPEDGFYLTQTTLQEGEERIFSKQVFLAQAASADDWCSISQAEKDAYEAAKVEQLENAEEVTNDLMDVGSSITD